MSNIFDDMLAAVADARTTLRAADHIADGIARLLVGRLRNGVSGYTLAKLKHELRDFNMTTKTWK